MSEGPKFEAYGMKWSKEDLGISLGSDCNQAHPQSAVFSLPNVKATHIGLVTSLACSTGIPHEREVAGIEAVDSAGEMETLSIKAGLHTSEWAWDRKDVQARVLHGHAPIFRSFSSADDAGNGFEGHHYAAVIPFKSQRIV